MVYGVSRTPIRHKGIKSANGCGDIAQSTHCEAPTSLCFANASMRIASHVLGPQAAYQTPI